ncbi:MAG: hypothetical protein AABZ31_12050 [Bdellovibrionota bacterium]
MKKYLVSLLLVISATAWAEEQMDFSCLTDNQATASDLAAQAVLGASLTSCRLDSDCRFNEKCKYGSCVDKDTCSSDYECNYGNICEFGRCKMAECRGGPYDCRAGERCTNGRCERDPFARRCSTARDCRPAERCSMGYCD